MATDDDAKPSWYQTDVKNISQDAQKLLEDYSGRGIQAVPLQLYKPDATFVTGNIVDDKDGEALTRSLGQKIDIVFASSFLHLFNYETQLLVATRLVQLLRDKTGAMVIGRHMRRYHADEYGVIGSKDGETKYLQNAESMKSLWYDVGQATQTRWKVECYQNCLTLQQLLQLGSQRDIEQVKHFAVLVSHALESLIAMSHRSEQDIYLTGADLELVHLSPYQWTSTDLS